jgi:hypothetical protein
VEVAMIRGRTVLLASLALLVACDGGVFTVREAGSGRDGPGAGSDANLFPDARALPDLAPRLDRHCGGQDIPIVLKKKGEIPDLHLVVDRSGSMMLPVDIFKPLQGTKWQVMRKVLISLVDSYYQNIRFALTLFPSDNSCGAGKIDVPLQLGNHPAIKTKLNKTGPNGNTPTHTSLAAVRTYLSKVPPAKGGRYVLLATDGMPNCGKTVDTDTSNETLAEVQKLAAAGTKVFVVGFGSIVAANPGLLDRLAQAGGAPNPKGPRKFYAATNEKELKDALFTIAGGIIPPPCTYTLTSKPADPEKVTVTFDGTAVPRSLSNKDGWNYTGGGTEITFYGSYCTRLRQGQVKQVKFLFGCKGPVVK